RACRILHRICYHVRGLVEIPTPSNKVSRPYDRVAWPLEIGFRAVLESVLGGSMRKWIAGLVLAALGVLAPAACSKSPDAPSVSFTSPVAAQPSNGTIFKFSAQPLTLTITNAVRTSSATATYTVEVATDSGFANK